MLRRRLAFVISSTVALLALTAGAAAGASPTAVWHMDETSGSVMTDSSGHGYNGQHQSIQKGVPGFIGKGYGFNGTSSKVIVPNAPGLNPGAKDLVITVHVKFTELPDEDYDLIRKGLRETPGGDWKAEIVNVSGKSIARCWFRGSAGSWQKTDGPDLADGAWHTITCEKHATTVVMRVDSRTWTRTKTIGSISNNAVISVGAKAEGGDSHLGSMDEITITIS